MADLAAIYLNWFVAALLAVTLLIGFLFGACLRALTALPKRVIGVLAGAMPVAFSVLLVVSDLRRHSAPTITEYIGWNSLFHLALLFGLCWLGALIGLAFVERIRNQISGESE